MSERSYPIQPPPEDDPRFTFGLVMDVAEVLTRHGYPPLNSGSDLLELHLALFRFLYTGGTVHGPSRGVHGSALGVHGPAEGGERDG